MRAVVLAASASILAGCTFSPAGVSIGGSDGPPGPGDDGGDLDGAPPSPERFRKAITVAPGRVSGTLADFPMYVELTDDDLAAHAGGSGADLHFVGGDGTTALDHELVAWDPLTGHLEAWVRVPSIAAGTTIYVRYGLYDDVPAPAPAGVFENGFVAVWHLDGAPGGGAGDVPDARGDVPATSSGLDASNQVDGVVGGGLAFDGADEQLAFTNPIGGASSHTISAWVDQQTVGHHSAVMVLGDGACTEARWLHARFNGGDVAAGFYCDDWNDTGQDIQGAGWTLVHWTYNGASESRLYLDGVLAAGPHTHAGTQSTEGDGGFIGNGPAAFGDPLGLLGSLDEIRIADVARGAAWIAAEHANQRAPEAFYVVGDEELVP